MAYTKTVWTDRVVEFPNQYKDQNNIQYTFTRDSGTVVEAGTNVNASNMNHLEQGVYDAQNSVDNLATNKETATNGQILISNGNGTGTFQTLNLSTYAPLASPALTGNPTAPTPSAGDNDTSIATTAFVNGEVGVANSTLVKTALNASGSANIYACRAWVAFNAVTSTILASGGVSSVSFGGASNTVNLSIAMADTNYAVNYTCEQVNNSATAGGDTTNGTVNGRSTTTISLYSNTGGHNNSYSQGVTSPYNAVSVFR